MLRDIEIAKAEREVDRIEIFERRRQKRQMQRDEGEGERAGPESERVDQRFRSVAASAGCSTSPSFKLPVR
jgi:hypothetical protein